jgi:hypothetical protein
MASRWRTWPSSCARTPAISSPAGQRHGVLDFARDDLTGDGFGKTDLAIDCSQKFRESLLAFLATAGFRVEDRLELLVDHVAEARLERARHKWREAVRHEWHAVDHDQQNRGGGRNRPEDDATIGARPHIFAIGAEATIGDRLAQAPVGDDETREFGRDGGAHAHLVIGRVDAPNRV